MHLATVFFSDNLGGNILYQWVEAAKDFLQEKSLRNTSHGSSNNVRGKVVVDNVANSSMPKIPIHDMDVPSITHGETITDRKSIFQGHAASVTSINQVK